LLRNPDNLTCYRHNYRATACLALAPPWLQTQWTLDQFPADSLKASRERHRKFVAAGRGANYNPWEQLAGQIFLGGQVFCDRMQGLIDSKPRSRQFPRAQRRIVLPSFDGVIDAVTDAFDESRDSIRQRSHRPARKALAQLGWEDANLTLTAIGEWLGLTDRAVSHLVKRGKELERHDDVYASRLRQIRLLLSIDRAPFCPIHSFAVPQLNFSFCGFDPNFPLHFIRAFGQPASEVSWGRSHNGFGACAPTVLPVFGPSEGEAA